MSKKQTRSRNPKLETATLKVEVTYDPKSTDAEALATAMDRLMETALSTPGILDDYSNPSVGSFFVEEQDGLVKHGEDEDDPDALVKTVVEL